MKILVLGAGAVGLYFGGVLALGGHAVQFGARSASAAAINTNGIRLDGPRGRYDITKVTATADPEEALGADIVLLCVKRYDLLTAAAQWRAALASAGAVICLQNGVDGQALLRRAVPESAGFGGLAFVAGRLESAGAMQYMSDMSSITFGGPGATANTLLQSFASSVNDAALPLPASALPVEDIAMAQWAKFIALATNAALTCITRSPAGVIYHDDELLALARESIAEIIAVGRAEGVALQDSQGEAALRMLQGLPAGMVASMHHDLVAGKPLEVEGLSGHIHALGKQHGIPTPFHRFVYTCLKPHIHGAAR
jgi:2-dehydropantoate 2-reductase